MRISDWSSDVCSSDLNLQKVPIAVQAFSETELEAAGITSTVDLARITPGLTYGRGVGLGSPFLRGVGTSANGPGTENSVAVYVDGVYYATKASAVTDLESVERIERSEEHTSELQSLMRISYAVFCLKKKKIRLLLHQHRQ